jgi:hypothetical protein
VELGYKGLSCCLRHVRQMHLRLHKSYPGLDRESLNGGNDMANQKSPRPQQILRTDQSNDCKHRLISQVPNRAKLSGRRESCGMERRLSMAPERMARLAALTQDSLNVA